LGTGYLWALFDRDRQFLHDRLAGTRVFTTRNLDLPEQPVDQEKTNSTEAG